MNYKKALLILWVINTLTIRITAQNAKILRGAVTDTLGKSLPFVNVVTQANDSSSILTFGSTDTEGVFEIDAPDLKRFVVKVAALGFESKIVWVNAEAIPPKLTFYLAPKEFLLKEAIVTASSKIVERNDTTTFKADAFRDSTERNLEALLAKLPGVEVDKNTGQIFVQGKPIKKIFIEGDDLTGRNYQLMSQNLAADVVDKIQIIDRFTENKLLKGLKKTDDKVINITLKSNRKNLLFGNASLALGNDWRTDNHLNLMTFGKRIKAVNFGSFNTIGSKSTANQMLEGEFVEDEQTQQVRALVSGSPKKFITTNRMPFVNLGAQSIQFNQAALWSSHFIVRPTEGVSLKGIFSFSRDRLRIFTDNQTQFLLQDSIFNLSELNEDTNRPTVFEGKLEGQWDMSQKSILRIAAQVQKTDFLAESKTVANGNDIQNNLTDKNTTWQTSADFTHRLSERKALTINALWVENDNNQRLDITQNQTRQLYPPLKAGSVSTPFSRLAQGVDKPMRFLSNTAQLFYSNQKFDVAFFTGLTFRREDLTTALRLNDAIIGGQDFANNTIFEQKNYVAGVNLSYNFGNKRLFLNTSGGFYDQNSTEILGNNSVINKDFYTLPTLGFNWKKDKKSVFFTYGYNFSLPQIADITSGFVVSDYRSAVRGASVLISANSHTFISSYQYGKIQDNFMAGANAVASFQKGGYRPDLSINSDFNFSSKVKNLFPTNSLRVSGSAEYYSSLVYARFKIKPTFSISDYQNALNGEDIRKTRFINSNIELSMRSAYIKWFNFHAGGNVMYSKATTKIMEQANTIDNQSVGAFLDFYFRFNKRFTAHISNEYFAFKQDQSVPQNYFFSNANSSYTFFDGRMTLSLILRNILDSQAFISNSVSDYLISTQQIRLVPRFFLIEYEFKF